MLVTAAVVGAVLALTLSGTVSGVGWTLAALAVAVAMPVVGWRPQRAVGALLPRRVAVAESGWIPVAVALAVVPSVRDAPWLALLCLAAAVAAGSLGVVGRSSRSVVGGMLAVPFAMVRGAAWAARGLGGLRGVAGLPRLGMSLLAGVALLVVFAPLLAGADPAFGALLDALVPRFDGSYAVARIVYFALGAAVVLAAAVLVAARTVPPLGPARPSPLRGVEWALPIGLLVALFAAYVVTTLSTLFGSDEHIRTTTGLTYAEYARGGFWQLLAVSALTMAVVVAGLRWTPLRTPGDRLRVRLLLGGLVALTLVVVGSALYRMWLYQQAYGLTSLRLVVAATEVWLAAGFVIMLVSVLRLRPDRPTRGVVAAGMLTLLVLAVLNPDRLVASQNVERWRETGKIDVSTLGELSADAAPVLATLPEPIRSCALTGLPPSLDRAAADGWRAANLSRASAADLLGGSRPRCPDGLYRGPALLTGED
ncbi:DUF4153 domain-containing protein [Pseudonocardia endophytica]|uniref:Uncharacterized protein DUF4173 n=1 Tax=Pseudonocardia endophytica TaxID=401976 RepID=A0A4R1HH50_PSEEN|nr:DUF4173 domain-containing protein [Pseudonocardia endophytica]TCK21058.1 uncharacterized protein DUF4173 [Pseudonocardia endophytica]